MRLILGSGSPRRKELLAPDRDRARRDPPPDIDEDPAEGRDSRVHYCRRIAREKADGRAGLGADEIVLCADTTVALGRRILGKPADAGEAAAFLVALSGRRHRVITAVAVRRGDRIWERDVVTAVKMKRLSDVELNAYLASGDWQGKAGGYAIQGPAGAFIPWIQGVLQRRHGPARGRDGALLAAAGYPVTGAPHEGPHHRTRTDRRTARPRP